MLKPAFLKKGDKIAIVSTARMITAKEIKEAIYFLETCGFQPVLGATIDQQYHQFAGNDQMRADAFQQLLDDDEIKAIWCARGGYGTIRIIDVLNFSSFCKRPKWIIGYSDITVLHSHINTLGVSTMHAAMPIDIHKGTKEAIDVFRNLLFGSKTGYRIAASKKNILGRAKGQLVGGNLSILYSLCGSKSSLDTDGKILCIEDLDEYLYHIDRMLWNLKRNGYFENLAGLIVGGMSKMHDNTIPFGKKAKKIILEIVEEYNFPVVFNFPMGHIEDNRPLILGAEVSIEVKKNEVLFNYID